MSDRILPGIYGKLPVFGDYVSRRLPAPFIRKWDTWLRNSLAASKEQLSDNWLDTYLTSPIWRFVLSPGCCGEIGGTGIVMPSVDKVGRYFPLTLAVLIDTPRDPLSHLFVTVSDWFGKLEDLALTALEDDIDFAQFDQQLQALVFVQPEPKIALRCKRKDTERLKNQLVLRVEMEDIAQIPDAFVHMGSHLLDRQLSAYSLWSTSGSIHSNPSVSVFMGMPPAGAYLEFLTGGCKTVEQAIETSDLRSTPSLEIHENIAIEAPSEEDRVEIVSWRSCGHSSIGRIRTTNEDAFIERPEIGLWAVADGMGGHPDGETASRSIVEALKTVAGSDNIEIFIHKITDCLQRVNASLQASAGKKHPDRIMGSTVVIMLAVGGQCASVWAGDSRLYRYRSGLLSQLTHDHSLAAEMHQNNTFAQSGVGDKVIQNTVTRAVGVTEDLILDTVRYEAKSGDTFLLCSDGLVKELRPDEIVDILGNGECGDKLRALIDRALSREARDNVTAIVVQADSAP